MADFGLTKPLTSGLTGATNDGWTPLDQQSTLAAFYLPGVGQTDAGAGACSAWADQSGNGRNLLQGTGADRPLINADGSLTFDGVSDWMRVAFTLVQPTVVTLLVNQLAETTAAARLMDGATGINSGGLLSAFPLTGQVQSFAGAFGPIAAIQNATAQVWQVLFSGASSSIRVNNGSEVVADAGLANMGGITFGADGVAVPTVFTNIRLYGASIRNANDAAINELDRAFWRAIGNTA